MYDIANILVKPYERRSVISLKDESQMIIACHPGSIAPLKGLTYTAEHPWLKYLMGLFYASITVSHIRRTTFSERGRK
jgi:hypothetical protein